MARCLEVPGPEEALLDLTDLVQAAGGVVVRALGGHARIALVHRPRYDDWSLPKGKLLDGEPARDAALREVLEETGLTCRPMGELPASAYVTSEGAPKIVRYWLMQVVGETDLRPTREVDEARWVPVGDAAELLTHDLDREILDAAIAWNGTAYLVRHAKAGSRAAWLGDDRDRPLSKAGRRQAKGLVRRFTDRRVDRILSSPAARCVETVRPLAEQRKLDVELRDELAEGAPFAALLALLDDLAVSHAVLSAHGDLIPAAVEHAERAGALIVGERGWKKGSTWTLEREAGMFVRATYLPAPDPDPPGPKRRRAYERRGRWGRGG